MSLAGRVRRAVRLSVINELEQTIRQPAPASRTGPSRSSAAYARRAQLVAFGETRAVHRERYSTRARIARIRRQLSATTTLPRATNTAPNRKRRGQSGHAEIQRLISRALRAVIDLDRLGEQRASLRRAAIRRRTRTAAIRRVRAVNDARGWMRSRGMLGALPVRDFVAAVSVGLFQGVPVLDLDYAEDSNCATDMNVVMTGDGRFVEVQGTAEGAAFSRAEMDALLALATQGIAQLIALQRQALEL